MGRHGLLELRWSLLPSDYQSPVFASGSSIMGRQDSQDVESNQESSAWRDWAAVFLWSVLGYLCLIVTVVGYFNPTLLPIDPTALVFNRNISPFFAFSQKSGYFPKPHGVKIVALVPFHYHERTEILDCYLQVSLVLSEGMHRNLIT